MPTLQHQYEAALALQRESQFAEAGAAFEAVARQAGCLGEAAMEWRVKAEFGKAVVLRDRGELEAALSALDGLVVDCLNHPVEVRRVIARASTLRLFVLDRLGPADALLEPSRRLVTACSSETDTVVCRVATAGVLGAAEVMRRARLADEALEVLEKSEPVARRADDSPAKWAKSMEASVLLLEAATRLQSNRATAATHSAERALAIPAATTSQQMQALKILAPAIERSDVDNAEALHSLGLRLVDWFQRADRRLFDHLLEVMASLTSRLVSSGNEDLATAIYAHAREEIARLPEPSQRALFARTLYDEGVLLAQAGRYLEAAAVNERFLAQGEAAIVVLDRILSESSQLQGRAMWNTLSFALLGKASALLQLDRDDEALAALDQVIRLADASASDADPQTIELTRRTRAEILGKRQ